MEGGLFLVFIIIAMAARAIEAMSKSRQRGDPPPQPPQRRPRAEYDRPHGTTQRRPDPRDVAMDDETADAAAEMIPDDLWQILTGQPKPRRPLPPPLPEPYEEAGIDEEQAAAIVYPDEEAEYEKRRRAEQEARARAALELQERRARGRLVNSVENAPVVVSLERPLPSPEKRHAAFHKKIDRPIVVETLTPQRSAREWLFEDDDLKRAVVLQEVLGTPKGLE